MKDKLLLVPRAAASLALLTLCSLLMLAIGLPTRFARRRLYTRWVMEPFSRLILRVWGLRLEVRHQAPFASCQTVYVINHTSAIDGFAIVAAGLPNTRFFLSGYLRKFPPMAVIGYVTGIFWTVKQAYPERRVRIFQRACRILRQTGESVCLSPEGTRVTTGDIGPFNKGAFHLAAALRAPMQPVFIQIPPAIHTGKGWYAKPGTIRVHIAAPLDTSAWRSEDAAAIKDQVWEYYRRWKEQLDD